MLWGWDGGVRWRGCGWCVGHGNAWTSALPRRDTLMRIRQWCAVAIESRRWTAVMMMVMMGEMKEVVRKEGGWLGRDGRVDMRYGYGRCRRGGGGGKGEQSKGVRAREHSPSPSLNQCTQWAVCALHCVTPLISLTFSPSSSSTPYTLHVLPPPPLTAATPYINRCRISSSSLPADKQVFVDARRVTDLST